MSNNLEVRFFRQETEVNCLPACVQMVLDYWGVARSQDKLVRILGTHPASDETVISVPLDEFMLAWDELDDVYAVIERR